VRLRSKRNDPSFKRCGTDNCPMSVDLRQQLNILSAGINGPRRDRICKVDRTCITYYGSLRKIQRINPAIHRHMTTGPLRCRVVIKTPLCPMVSGSPSVGRHRTRASHPTAAALFSHLSGGSPNWPKVGIHIVQKRYSGIRIPTKTAE
jgi:hypothetical protein